MNGEHYPLVLNAFYYGWTRVSCYQISNPISDLTPTCHIHKSICPLLKPIVTWMGNITFLVWMVSNMVGKGNVVIKSLIQSPTWHTSVMYSNHYVHFRGKEADSGSPNNLCDNNNEDMSPIIWNVFQHMTSLNRLLIQSHIWHPFVLFESKLKICPFHWPKWMGLTYVKESVELDVDELDICREWVV